MIARVESAQNWLENITYQMNHMNYKDQSRYLAGYVILRSRELDSYGFDRAIGLLKKFATESAQDTARDAVQVFGGRGITRGGMGRFIEHVSHHILLSISLKVEIYIMHIVSPHNHLRCVRSSSLPTAVYF
jgi:alkylation response protein AidB-like acyl-CoA dehydrogenase